MLIPYQLDGATVDLVLQGLNELKSRVQRTHDAIHAQAMNTARQLEQEQQRALAEQQAQAEKAATAAAPVVPQARRPRKKASA